LPRLVEGVHLPLFRLEGSAGLCDLEACHRELTSRLRTIATGDGSALERLRLLIATQIRLGTVEMPAAVGLFLRPFDWPPNIAAAVTEWRNENDDIFRSVINEGVKTGEFSPAQPAVSRLCMQRALAFVPDWYHRHSKDQGRAVVDTLMCLFVAS
jgi:hypothetical protein